MTKTKFYSLFGGVAGPSCAGAPYPKFKPSCINESKFANELRMKEMSTEFIVGDEATNDTIAVDWKSQEWNDAAVDGLVEEIRRCFKHIGFAGNVELKVHSRSSEGEAYREFEVI